MAIAIALAVLPIYLLTASYSTLQSNDPRSAALAGWSVAASGSLAFDTRWPSDAASWGVEGEDGRTYSNRFPGVVGVAVLAYALADLSGAVETTPVAHPYDVPLWPATVVGAAIAAAAIAATYRVLRQLALGERTTLLATGVVAFASPVWSVSADALWTHGLTHLLLMLTVLAILERRTAAAAVAVALVITMRPHLALAVGVLAFIEEDRRRRTIIWVGAAAGLALVVGYSMTVFGQPLPAAGYDVEALADALPIASPLAMSENLIDWVMNPYRGLAVYVPLAMIAIPVIPIAMRTAPRWAKIAAAAGLVYGATQLSLIRASGGVFFFGHRTTIEMLALTVPLVVVGFSRASAQSVVIRRVLAVAIVASFAVHAYGAVTDMPNWAEAILIEHQAETGPESRE